MSFALPDALFFTGIDWAAETHAVCVMNAAGKVVMECVIETKANTVLQSIHGPRGDLHVTFKNRTFLLCVDIGAIRIGYPYFAAH